MLTRFLEPGEHLGRWIVEMRFTGGWGVVYVLGDNDPNPKGPAIVIGRRSVHWLTISAMSSGSIASVPPGMRYLRINM